MDKAAAVKYIEGLPAPFLIAKGKGELAAKIIESAEQHGIMLHRDTELADDLFLLNPGDWIPEDLFETVAYVLAFVYTAQREIG